MSGSCVCCDRDGLQIVAKGLCGRCYAYSRDNKIFKDADTGLWLARTEFIADRLGCSWQGDPDLSGEFEPLGDGDFSQAAKVDESEEVAVCAEAHGAGEAVEVADDADLLEGFETYEKYMNASDAPTISVQRGGKMHFSASAERVFDLSGMSHVKLHYNHNTNEMAIQLLVGDDSGTALRLSNKAGDKDRCFHVSGFFRAMGIKVKVRRYPLRHLRPGILVTTLDLDRAA